MEEANSQLPITRCTAWTEEMKGTFNTLMSNQGK